MYISSAREDHKAAEPLRTTFVKIISNGVRLCSVGLPRDISQGIIQRLDVSATRLLQPNACDDNDDSVGALCRGCSKLMQRVFILSIWFERD